MEAKKGEEWIVLEVKRSDDIDNAMGDIDV